MRKFYLLAVLFVFLLGKAQAYHIIGGELYYDCLGGYNYQVTLKLYRDCSNPDAAPFDDPLQIYVFNASGVLVDSLVIPFPGAVTIDPDLTNPCISSVPYLCIQQCIYTGTIHLPPSAGGYDLVYQRCCRNTSIINIVEPGTQGATYVEHVPDPGDGCNSSPRFNNFPPIVICAGFPITFDHSATDPDGDVLVYDLCYSYAGATEIIPDPSPAPPPPYTPINYQWPYSADYPMDASPPLSIEAATGFLTGTPTTLGQFVVGICVSEFKDGVLIGTHRRDFQFNVTDCEPLVVAATEESFLSCNDYSVSFTNESFGTDQFYWNFGVPGITSDTSNAFEPTYTYPDTGTYTAMLIAYPGELCADTFYTSVEVYPGLHADFSAITACSNSPSIFTDGSIAENSTITGWHWDFDDGTTSTLENPTHIFSSGGTYSVHLTITDDKGCSDNITQTITIPASPHAEFTWTNACQNVPVTFTSTSTVTGCGIADASWTVNGTDFYSGTSFTCTFAVPGIESVLLAVTSDEGCIDSVLHYILIADSVHADVIADTAICEGDSAHLWARNGIYFHWFPDSYLDNPEIFNPYAFPPVTTTYGVVVSDNCTSDTAYTTVTVLPLPDLVAGVDTSVLRNHPVQLFATAEETSSYEWSPATGLSDPNIPDPIATPYASTVYVVTATGWNGCIISDTVTVLIEEPCNRFRIPNAFSPNGDGVNDIFRIRSYGDDNVEAISIYDRWGQLLFQSDDMDTGWDGSFKGIPQEIDSYIYVIDMICQGEKETLKGTLTLLR